MASFQELPEEMVEAIINLLPQNAALQLREVDTRMKYHVDTFYFFEFDDFPLLSNETFIRLPAWRIRSVFINRLSPMPFYPRPWPPPQFFEYPHHLKILRIECMKIRNTDYKWLLQEVGRHLTKFSLEIGNQTDYITGLDLNFTFESLRKLKIIDRRVDFLVGDIFNSNPDNDIYLNIVENISVNCPLNSISFDIERNGIEQHGSVVRYTHALFVLISQHGLTLTKIRYSYSNIRMREITGFQNEITAYTFDLQRFNNVINLTHFDVGYSFATNEIQPIDEWKYLLDRQRRLEEMHLSNISNCISNGYLTDVRSRNINTLKQLSYKLNEFPFF